MHHDLPRLRRALVDLRPVAPRVYFVDLILTAMVVHGSLALGTAYGGVAGALVGAAVAGLALSRAALFVHELSHQRDAVRGLRLAWHAAIGIWFLFPSFVYEHAHREHHRLAVYRTERDPEHAPSRAGCVARAIAGVVGAAALPLLLWARWAILAPASLLSPRLRAWTWARVSSLTTNPRFRLRGEATRGEIASEIACAAWSWALAAGLATGAIPARLVIAAALALVVAVAISDLRGDFLHRRGVPRGDGSLERQVADSLDLDARGPLRLLFPMGIGFHALHHLAPWLPYHALRAAHARVGSLSVTS